jgi:hypothetical protein
MSLPRNRIPESAMAKPVTPHDMFDMWQKMVNPGAYPLQSLMFPMPDAGEIQKKIAELETVEHWLRANVSMIQLTVKSLQYQLAMLKGGEKAMEVFAESGAKEAPGAKPEEFNPAMWAWNAMAEAGKAAGEVTAKPPPHAKKKKKT